MIELTDNAIEEGKATTRDRPANEIHPSAEQKNTNSKEMNILY
jgi:hypothetical protein